MCFDGGNITLKAAFGWPFGRANICGVEAVCLWIHTRRTHLLKIQSWPRGPPARFFREHKTFFSHLLYKTLPKVSFSQSTTSPFCPLSWWLGISSHFLDLSFIFGTRIGYPDRHFIWIWFPVTLPLLLLREIDWFSVCVVLFSRREWEILWVVDWEKDWVPWELGWKGNFSGSPLILHNLLLKFGLDLYN